jgi:hypothetical protein
LGGIVGGEEESESPTPDHGIPHPRLPSCPPHKISSHGGWGEKGSLIV